MRNKGIIHGLTWLRIGTSGVEGGVGGWGEGRLSF